MRSRRATFFAVILFAVIPGVAVAQSTIQNSSGQPSTLDQAVDRIIAQEKAEMQMLRQYSPLVETYIQLMRPDQNLGTAPAGDKYYLGKANLGKGLDMQPLTNDKGAPNLKYTAGGLGTFISMSMQFLPRGFLQMIYIDMNAFDKQHYKFEYVRREFLGEVRCLVFDVTAAKENDRGRFEGRIWVEDQGFHIVRFNGAYQRPSKASYFFHFDSWRLFSGDNQWLPAYIYSEESDLRYGMTRKLSFKAQVRLWGYDLSAVRVRREQELNKILVESKAPVKDQASSNNDYSPIEEQRLWERQAEDNIADRMEKLGVLSPRGDVDKVLETVVNNLEVTNNLDIEPDMRCRVLMTSTLESFVIGHTKYAFYDRRLWDDQDTFRHFGFARTPEEEQTANQKALELLAHSPYKNQLDAARQFVQVLQTRSKEIPNLISPHLGDRVPITWAGSNNLAAAAEPVSADSPTAQQNPKVLFAALPLGGRLKFDPWSDQVQLLKAKPVGMVAEREKMPFEITPFILYLTRDRITPTETATIPVDTAGKTTDNRASAADPVDTAKKTQ